MNRDWIRLAQDSIQWRDTEFTVMHLQVLEWKKAKEKGKALLVNGHEGPYDCETSRRPQFL
jgi:hypothetical protein